MSSEPARSEGEEKAVDYFLQDMEFHGKSERTREAYERVLREFDSFLREEQGESPESANHRDCLSWIHQLRERNVAESTVATYAAYLHRFYAYMAQVGVFESNPMTLVMEEMDERIERNPTRRDITLTEMRSFVAAIQHPLDKAVVMTLLKTGMRAGELCNLDLRDLTLPVDGTEIRPQLANRERALYVSPEPTVGAVVAGEKRTSGNKRKRETVIPIDEELEAVLTRWLAVRPDPRSPANPVFVSTREWGKRLTSDTVGRIVREYARDNGWHSEGGTAAENVTPHYFRHFFTTHLRDRTGDRGIVKYLRGDVASDIIDTYTHNWGDRVRETYAEHIYELL